MVAETTLAMASKRNEATLSTFSSRSSSALLGVRVQIHRPMPWRWAYAEVDTQVLVAALFLPAFLDLRTGTVRKELWQAWRFQGVFIEHIPPFRDRRWRAETVKQRHSQACPTHRS